MAVPARTNILLEIKSCLEGITHANGYATDVKSVSPTLISRDETQAIGALPAMCFGAGRETPAHQAFQDMRVQMPVVILGYVAETGWIARSAALNLMIDDTIACLSKDPTLNKNAISLYFQYWETDEPDPDATTGFPGGGGTMIMEIRVDYDRSVQQTT